MRRSRVQARPNIGENARVTAPISAANSQSRSYSAARASTSDKPELCPQTASSTTDPTWPKPNPIVNHQPSDAVVPITGFAQVLSYVSEVQMPIDTCDTSRETALVVPPADSGLIDTIKNVFSNKPSEQKADDEIQEDGVLLIKESAASSSIGEVTNGARGRSRFLKPKPNLTGRSAISGKMPAKELPPIGYITRNPIPGQLTSTDDVVQLHEAEMLVNDCSSVVSEHTKNTATSTYSKPMARSRSRFTKIKPNLTARTGTRRVSVTQSDSEEESKRSAPLVPANTTSYPSVDPTTLPNTPCDKLAPSTELFLPVVESSSSDICVESNIVPVVATEYAATEDKPKKKPRRYKVTWGDSPPDRTKMTMKDLIYWNPKRNVMKSTGKNSAVKQKPLDDHEESVAENENEDRAPTPVPQVKIGPDGSIILNEESMVVDTSSAKVADGSETELIHENESEVTYRSFKKNAYKKRPWSMRETLRFYRALSVVGTDFTLIQQIFKTRSRTEIKRKFKREERENQQLIDKALRERHAEFDMSIFQSSSESDSEKLAPEEEPTVAKRTRKCISSPCEKQVIAPQNRLPRDATEISVSEVKDQVGAASLTGLQNPRRFVLPRQTGPGKVIVPLGKIPAGQVVIFTDKNRTPEQEQVVHIYMMSPHVKVPPGGKVISLDKMKCVVVNRCPNPNLTLTNVVESSGQSEANVPSSSCATTTATAIQTSSHTSGTTIRLVANAPRSFTLANSEPETTFGVSQVISSLASPFTSLSKSGTTSYPGFKPQQSASRNEKQKSHTALYPECNNLRTALVNGIGSTPLTESSHVRPCLINSVDGSPRVAAKETAPMSEALSGFPSPPESSIPCTARSTFTVEAHDATSTIADSSSKRVIAMPSLFTQHSHNSPTEGPVFARRVCPIEISSVPSKGPVLSTQREVTTYEQKERDVENQHDELGPRTHSVSRGEPDDVAVKLPKYIQITHPLTGELIILHASGE